jgi:single-stranded-DNA-specific exonuclease
VLGRFRAYLEATLGGEVEVARRDDALLIDGAISAAGANSEAVATIARAGPFGAGNPEPVVVLPSHTLIYVEDVGQAHTRARLRAADGCVINAIAFRAAGQKPELRFGKPWPRRACGRDVVLGSMERKERVQLRLMDLAPRDTWPGMK